MIPLLLTAGRAAMAAGRVSSAVSAAKGVTSILKARGYISEAGKPATQMARAGTAPRGTSSAFRNPYTFANKPGEQATAGSDMGSSVQENTQTKSNTKKQTLIISADNVFLRTSQAIMQSAMPEAPQNIERASGTDEPTSIGSSDKKTTGLGAAAGIILGKLLYKVFDLIVQKIKELFKQLRTLYLESLSGIYRTLDEFTPGKFFKNKADAIDKQLAEESAAVETPIATTPGISPAPTETTSGVSPVSEPIPVATDYTPAVTPTTPTTPTSPTSSYAPPSGFFGAPTLGTAKPTDGAMPIVAGSNITRSFAEKLINVESGGKNVANRSGVGGKPTSSAFGIAQFTKPTFETIMKNVKPGHPLYDYENKELNITKGKKTFEQFKTDVTFQRIALDTLTTGNIDILKSKGVAVNDATAYLAHFLGAGTAAKVLAMPNDTPLSKILKKDQITANPAVLGPKKVGTSTVERTVGDLKTWAAKKMKINPDTVDMNGSPAINNIKPQSSGLSATPQSLAGSLTAPTQATGRNIEMTSQILNSAPSVTNTAQNTQPVVINNINAPTVASGKGSSGPAIEMSVFRNIDNSIQANTNRHLRAGILGV